MAPFQVPLWVALVVLALVVLVEVPLVASQAPFQALRLEQWQAVSQGPWQAVPFVVQPLV